jgi:acyl carrier protein phosphodiesterase
MWLEDLAAEADPTAALVEGSLLTRSQVDAAVRHRAAYPDEIAARIELHRRGTAAAEKHWSCCWTRDVLAGTRRRADPLT